MVSDFVLTLLSRMVEEERQRIRIAQREGIEIAKSQGKFKSGAKKYHAGATGKDKVIYDRIVQLLKSGMSVMDIHREVGVARNTIYGIKKDLNFVSNDEIVCGKIVSFRCRSFLSKISRNILFFIYKKRSMQSYVVEIRGEDIGN